MSLSMECYRPYYKTASILPCGRRVTFDDRRLIGLRHYHKVFPAVVAAAGRRCEPGSGLNAPMELKSESGKSLSRILQNRQSLFHIAAADELKQLADDRDSAVARMVVSSGSDEECLHTRIAELKSLECETAVEDIMYILIFYKFSKLRVPLLPKLAHSVYDGKLQNQASKIWELESIYTPEIIELVRRHVNGVVGLKKHASISENLQTTEITKHILCKVYTTTVQYGYYLKSVSLRHKLETCLHFGNSKLDSLKYPVNLLLGKSFMPKQNRESLRSYMLKFDKETVLRCAKPKSKEAKDLIEKHSRALFGDQTCYCFENDVGISISYLTFKRFIMEALAFGYFLWDTEEYVDGIFKFRDW